MADFIEQFDPPRERCWIAQRQGRIVGSITAMAEDLGLTEQFAGVALTEGDAETATDAAPDAEPATVPPIVL